MKDVPNQICLLDRGVILSGRAQKAGGEVIETFIHPQKARPPLTPEFNDGWLIANPSGKNKEGARLFYSYNQLLEHLKNNVLLPTSYLNYLRNTVRIDTRFFFKRSGQNGG